MFKEADKVFVVIDYEIADKLIQPADVVKVLDDDPELPALYTLRVFGTESDICVTERVIFATEEEAAYYIAGILRGEVENARVAYFVASDRLRDFQRWRLTRAISE